MKKKLTGILLVLVLCLSLFPASAAGKDTYTRVLENMKIVSDNQDLINSLTRDPIGKCVEANWGDDTKSASAVLTLDDASFPSPYGFYLKNMKLTMSDFSADQVPSREGTQQFSFHNADVTLRGSSKLISAEREECRFGYHTTLDGPGSLTVTLGSLVADGLTMRGGTLIVDKPACDSVVRSLPGLSVGRGHGFTMEGGELIVKNGGSSDWNTPDMTDHPCAAIDVYGNLTITGGRVYADPGKDVRDGSVPPCAELKAEWGYEEGTAHIMGGVFNVGDLKNNTVLDLAVEPGYRVVPNEDPETREKYPYAVRPDTEGLSIFPAAPTVTKGKTLQMTYSGITAEPKIWSVTGNLNPGTVISKTGLLTVAEEETAETLTVTVSAGVLSASTTVTVEPEYFRVWLVLAHNTAAFQTTVVDELRVEKGKTFILPDISDRPDMQAYVMSCWRNQNNWQTKLPGDISDPVTGDVTYAAELDMNPSRFAIEEQWYDLPKAGECLNSNGGSQKTGNWWIEQSASGDVELTLNGVILNRDGTRYSSVPGIESSLFIVAPDKHTLVVHVRNGENRIRCPEPGKNSIKAVAFYQAAFRTDQSVYFDIAPDSSLILEDSAGSGVKILLYPYKDGVQVMGGGMLKLIPRGENCMVIEEDIAPLSVSDHSRFEMDATAVNHRVEDLSLLQDRYLYSVGDITIEDGSSFLFKSSYYPLSSGIYDIGSMNARVGLFTPTGQREEMSQDSLNKYKSAALYVEINKDVPAPAEIVYPLMVAGKQVTESNRSNILGDGKVSYDSVTNTLTLNSATVQPPAGGISHPSQYSALYYYGQGMLNIVNSGFSYLNGREDDTYSAGISFDNLSSGNGITVDGDGVLRCSGWTGADRSYGYLGSDQGDFIVAAKPNGVAVELRGASCACSTHRFSAPRAVISDHRDGSAPRLYDKGSTNLDTTPFLALYNVISHDFYAAYGEANNTTRLLTPLHVNRALESLNFDLQAGIYDQYGLEANDVLDQNLIKWTLSPEDSGDPETVEYYMSHNFLTLDEQGRLRMTVTGPSPQPPTYVCAKMTYTPSGLEKTFPVLIINYTQDPEITVRFKPDVPKRIYREGDDFDASTIDVTVSYADYGPDNVRDSSVFLLENPEILFGTDMAAGTCQLKVRYYDPVHKQVFLCPFSIDPVLGCDYIMKAPDGKHVQVTSRSGATLVIADYTSGQMTALQTYDIPAGTEEKSYAITATMRAFLLNQDSAPTCPAVSGQN